MPQAEEKQLAAKFLDDTNSKPPIVMASSSVDNAQNLFLAGGLQGNYSDLAVAIQKNPYLLDDPYIRLAFQARMGLKATDKPDIQAT